MGILDNNNSLRKKSCFADENVCKAALFKLNINLYSLKPFLKQSWEKCCWNSQP